jgi:hypothetical protein
MRNVRHYCVCLCSAAVIAAAALTATDGSQANRRPTVPVEVSLKVGEAPYAVKGQGTCTHAARAGIYDTPAQQWTVRHQEEGRSVQLTFWKPTNGSAEMFSLSVRGKSDVNISTVRGGQMSGSGTVKLQPSGKGGTFTIEAKGKAGEPVSGTFKCEAFTAAVAEGGD